MAAPEPRRLLSTLKATLANQGIDADAVVAEFGQVQASEERARGKEFTLRDHLCGLVFSLLSSQRPWGPIEQNSSRIEAIFFGFDPQRVRVGNPDSFIRSIRDLRCGNRQIKAQDRKSVV